MSSETNPPRKKSSAGIRIAVYLLFAAGAAGYFFLPPYLRRQANERFLSCRTNVKNINIAVEMFIQDHDGANPREMTELYPKYLVQPLICPAAGSSTYQLRAEHSKDNYVIQCSGHHHADVGLGPNRPAYSKSEGLLDR